MPFRSEKLSVRKEEDRAFQNGTAATLDVGEHAQDGEEVGAYVRR